jgi:hypothetical protein
MMAQRCPSDPNWIRSFIPPSDEEWELFLREHPEWSGADTPDVQNSHRARKVRKMSSWRDTYGSYLKAVDLPKGGKRVKIVSVDEEVLREGERPKLVARLKGLSKGWVLNATNCELLEEITGSENPDEWCNKTVELFNDRTVRGPNGEKGGIRVRKPAGAKEQPSEAAPFEDEDLDDLDDE